VDGSPLGRKELLARGSGLAEIPRMRYFSMISNRRPGRPRIPPFGRIDLLISSVLAACRI
jgi:hypothetical protein